MSVLLVSKNRDFSTLENHIRTIDPNIDVEIWPAIAKPDRVQLAVAWNHPENVLDKFPNLKAITSLGAGVDHLVTDTTLPTSVTLSRMVLPSLSEQISDYVLMAALNIIRHSHLYNQQQARAEWTVQQPLAKNELHAGVMGLGELGIPTAQKLEQNGFTVSGWSKTKKKLPSIKTYASDELNAFLEQVNMLICMLPLTPETAGILNLDTIKKLKQPAFIINVARGEHLVDEDLIYAIDAGLINHAVLDVFSTEPLPNSHPFWNRKKVTITPHTAAITNEKEAAQQIVENYKRLLSGMEMLNPVSRDLGY
jgi:glyoxylate/hydroxypyruvate reductase A